MNKFIKGVLHINLKKINNNRLVIWLTATALVLFLLIGGCVLYVSDYYRADTKAIEAFSESSDVQKSVLSDGVIAYGESDSDTGFIFYPGGKVEYTAYEPLMSTLASKGVLCVLVEMPFNLAVLDMNAADGVREKFPEVEHWYIGGHSLGGSMAGSYIAKHSESFEGIVLLASYITADISDTGLRALSLCGTSDGVMNREKYEKYRKNLPVNFTEIEISGGNHAYFGMYGEQQGDGTATIKPSEQIIKTAEYISEFILEGEN